MALSTKQVNTAIAHTGLTVEKVDNSHFVLVNAEGDVAATVMVSSLSHLTRQQWVAEAEAAEKPAPTKSRAGYDCRPRGQMAAARFALQKAGGDTDKAVKLCMEFFAEIGPRSEGWAKNQVSYVKGYLAGAQRLA
jgi:ferredoxin-NADP reductase